MGTDMRQDFSDKTVLIVQGSLLSGAELESAFKRAGARVFLAGNIISAFSLLNRTSFDGAVIDQGLHNAAFDVCCELRDLGIPYVCSTAPHRLQSQSAREREANRAVERLGDIISSRAEAEIDTPGGNWIGGQPVGTGRGRRGFEEGYNPRL
jgi:hypothetical protein